MRDLKHQASEERKKEELRGTEKIGVLYIDIRTMASHINNEVAGTNGESR
jgi:hypothetical protein